MSASNNSNPGFPTIWNDKTKFEVSIVDNHIALSSKMDEQTLIVDELIVSSISADKMDCVIRHLEISNNGDVVTVPD